MLTADVVLRRYRHCFVRRIFADCNPSGRQNVSSCNECVRDALGVQLALVAKR